MSDWAAMETEMLSCVRASPICRQF